MNKPNFSIVLIARNESKTLSRLIHSLSEFQKIGGEVLLLDTGSTDGTANIARSLGCIVHEVGDKFRIRIGKNLANQINTFFVCGDDAPVVKQDDTMFDYASARNYIAEFATNDMIATPDCDEIYTAFNIEKIQALIESGIEQFEYQFVFAHDAEGKPLVQFLHSKFYNRNRLSWKGVIHEVLQGEAKRLYLDESIIKLEHYQNVETNRSGYLKGLAYDCFLNPQSDRNSHYFARECMYTGRPKTAIKEFERHISMDKWPVEKAQSMLFIGDCYEALGNREKAQFWYLKSFELEPNRREPLMRLAEIAYKENNHVKTMVYCVAALQVNGVNFYANFQPYYTNVPHELLYWAYWYLGQKEKSMEHFDIAFAYSPNNEKYKHDRKFYYSELPTVNIVIPQLGREEGLNKCLTSIEQLNYPKELITISVIEGDQAVPVKVKIALAENKSDFICYAANDMYFAPDSLLIAINESMLLNKGLVSFNEGYVLTDKGNICTHFVINKELVEQIGGEIFNTKFHHAGCDNLLWAKCEKLNQAHHSENAKIVHNHFSKGSEYDEIYNKGWKNVKEDRALLKEELSKL